MVKALHAAGLEVILDVVFNHTAEGGDNGPTLCFRGLDDAAYYRLRDDGSYVDTTGCGNTLDTHRPHALRLVMDSLRYWAQEMHVDGFRFDLAASLGRQTSDFDPFGGFLDAVGQDPVLSEVKLIAEPWDAAREATRSETSLPDGASGTAATATPCATSGAVRPGRSPTSPRGSRARRTCTAAVAGRPRPSTSSPSTTASRCRIS
jgi:glycogen operon protein